VSTGVRFHCCVSEEVFVARADAQVQFAEDLAAVHQQVRARVLRWFARAGHLDL
jgi:hypothetical protein